MIEINKKKAIIEAVLFSAGREVKLSELMAVLEETEENIIAIITMLQNDYEKDDRGIEIININDAYQLASKKGMYDYLYLLFDKRTKPNLSQAAMETLAIIAYNPKITRAEIEAIRGVNSDGTIYKLLEYELIENAGRLDAPGKPTTYQTTSTFLKLFGIKDLEKLPDLPRYKLDENQQIIIDDIIENEEEEIKSDPEAPMPERELKES